MHLLSYLVISCVPIKLHMAVDVAIDHAAVGFMLRLLGTLFGYAPLHYYYLCITVTVTCLTGLCLGSLPVCVSQCYSVVGLCYA